MAEETKKETPPTPTPTKEVLKPVETPKEVKTLASTEDIQKAKNHLLVIKQKITEEYSGKVGHNPYIWVARKITPILTALAVEPVLQTTIVQAMAVKEEKPEIDANPEIPQRLVPSGKIAPLTNEKK